MPTKPTLVLTYEVHGDLQRVFDALTQPRHLDRYFTSNATVDLQVGGRFGNGDGESGKFLKVAVPRQIVFTYTNSQLGFDTEVDLQLVPSFPLGGIRLRLVHKGLDPKKVNEDTVKWLELRWKYLAASLSAYLSGDKTPRFETWKQELSPVYAERT